MTAYTRQYMDQIFHLLDAYGENKFLYYSDTNSLLVNEEGKKILENNGLIHKDKIGKLKHEDTYTQAVFVSPKAYMGISKSSQKTIKMKSVKQISNIEISDLYHLVVNNQAILIDETRFQKSMVSVIIDNVVKKIQSSGPKFSILDLENNRWVYPDLE